MNRTEYIQFRREGNIQPLYSFLYKIYLDESNKENKQVMNQMIFSIKLNHWFKLCWFNGEQSIWNLFDVYYNVSILQTKNGVYFI